MANVIVNGGLQVGGGNSPSPSDLSPFIGTYTSPEQKFEIGKAITFNEGKDVSIFCTGHLVWKALEACEALSEKGIDAEVINIHTIKPLDETAIIRSARKTGSVVTAEEHQVNGGLGDVIAHVLSKNFPVFISTSNLTTAVAICIVVGVAAGIIPASQAARMDPVAAIRGK